MHAGLLKTPLGRIPEKTKLQNGLAMGSIGVYKFKVAHYLTKIAKCKEAFVKGGIKVGQCGGVKVSQWS